MHAADVRPWSGSFRLIGHRLTLVEDFTPYRTADASLWDLVQEQARSGATGSTVASFGHDGYEYRTTVRGGRLSARARAWLDTEPLPYLLSVMPLCFGPRGLHLPPHGDRCFVLDADQEWRRADDPPHEGQVVARRSRPWVCAGTDMTVGGYTVNTYAPRRGRAEHTLALLPSGEVYFVARGEIRHAPRAAGGCDGLLAPFVHSVMVRSFVHYAQLQAERCERGDIPLNLVTDHGCATAALDRHIRRHDRRLWRARRVAALDRLLLDRTAMAAACSDRR